MAGEPPHKKQRFEQTEPTPESVFADVLPTTASETHLPSGSVLDNIDPFLSPATSWGVDEFAHNADYLASQEQLRALLFTTAQSAAPTRAGTPVRNPQMS
jgi:hypothetical protein